jgi:hypothetical protein
MVVRLNLTDALYIDFLYLRGWQEKVTASQSFTQCGKCSGFVVRPPGFGSNVSELYVDVVMAIFQGLAG